MKFHPEYPFDCNSGENVVWLALRIALEREAGNAFYRVPLIGNDGFVRYEPDIIILPEDGLPLILECKGFRIDHIVAINGASWQMSDEWYRSYERPVSQAREQSLALRELLQSQGVQAVRVRPFVALPFVLRQEWNASAHSGTALDGAILFADDLEPSTLLAWWRDHRQKYPLQRDLAKASLHCLASPADEGGKPSQPPGPLGLTSSAQSRVAIQATSVAPASSTRAASQAEPGLHFLRYEDSPPSAQFLRERIGLDDGAPYTYLVATAALERARRAEGLGGQHQLRKDLRREASQPEQMELLFHKALRHFIHQPVLTRAEESLLLQRAIRAVVAHESTLVRQQLLRDVFAWREVMAELEEEGVDLAQVTEDAGAQWVHPGLLDIARTLQGAYHKARLNAGRGRTSFEDLAGQYLDGGFHPTPVVVMEGFTRLTVLQTRLLRRCLEYNCRVWIVQPYRAGQEAGFAAIERTWQELAAGQSYLHEVQTPPLSSGTALHHLQRGLFARDVTAQAFPGDKSVRISAFAHRNDEIAAVVAEVIELLETSQPLHSTGDLAVVCSDPLGMAPLLREEAELQGRPDLFAVPPRQLLLTPVGRFALTLYEIWPAGHLHLDPSQFATLLAAGWLGGQTQHSFEKFEAVAAQQFMHCRSEEEWRQAFVRIGMLRQRDAQLANLARRLPASCIDKALLQDWESALDTVVRLCRRLLVPGERSLGAHIQQLLDEIEKLDEHRILLAEREVLTQIRDALLELTHASSVPMAGEEFGRILGGLIHQREDPDTGELLGTQINGFPQRVWVVGPEGIDNVTRKRVFFLGLDDAHLPARGLPPWPRGPWSVDEHVERQRYRFLAVARAARDSLCMSFARQDWERDLRPSPYLEHAARMLARGDELRRSGGWVVLPESTPARSSTVGPHLRRDTFSLEELALFQLCPHRFKLEAMSNWGQCYGNVWQLGWLARGVWFAEVLEHIALTGSGVPPDTQVMHEAMRAVKTAVQDRLAGLPKLAWLTIERDVRRGLEYLARPWGLEGQLLRVLPEPGAGPSKEVRPDGQRTVRIQAQISYRQVRGQRPVALPDIDLASIWLMAGKGEDSGGEVDPRLRRCVKWWRDMVFQIDSPKALDAARNNELLALVLAIEQASFPKANGDHCRYCPVVSTCMGVNP